MPVVIRMARAGTKKRPIYHIVFADSRAPRDGRFIERLGYFNPLLPKDNKERLKLDMDKVKSWIAKGAQPSSGASGETFASAISGITVYSENVDVPMKWRSSSPSREKRAVPSGRYPSPCCSRIATQRFVRVLRQWTHVPHSGANSVITWSPGATSETSGPTRSTTPAPSWPSTHGA